MVSAVKEFTNTAQSAANSSQVIPDNSDKKTHVAKPPNKIAVEMHHKIPKKLEKDKPDRPATQAAKPDEKNDFQKTLANISQKITIYGAYMSAILHWGAAAADVLSYGTGFQKTLDFLSLNFTKLIFSASCGLTALQAGVAKRSWEFVSRILEPFFFIVANLEDMQLARGFTLGLSQLVGANEKKLKESGNEGKSWSIDAGENFKAFFEILGETIKGGIGANRKVLTGFTVSNVYNRVKEAISTFSIGKTISSFFNIFKKFEIDAINKAYKEFLNISGLDKIRQIFVGDEKRDEGHTVALSAYIMMIGSLIGYFFGVKDKTSPIYKFGGLLRNVGGAIADISLFGHPDVEMNLSGTFLGIATVLDAVQRFFPRHQRLLNIVNNLASGAYNIGVNLYLNRSSRKNKQEETRFGDASGKPAQAN